MATIALKRTGQKMPVVGYGLWKVPKPIAADTVYGAIQAGYRLFDGAGDYGNEKEAGEGIRRAISDGLVKREDIFVTSKLWQTFHSKEHVKKITKYQLDLWGLDYFDLFLVHFPISLEYVDPSVRFPPEWFYDGKSEVRPANVPFQETWEAMEELVGAGLAKNIGVSNVASSLLNDIHRYARIAPQVLQVEIHPYLTQEALIKYAKDTLGMAITSYSTFGPASWYEIGVGKEVPNLLEHDTIAEIASSVRKTPAQVILRWATQQGLAVVPKTNNIMRLAQNLSVTDFDLSEQQMKAINSLNINLRLNDPAGIDGRLQIFA